MQLTEEDIRDAKWYLRNPNLEHKAAFAALGLDVSHPRWNPRFLNEGCEWFAGRLTPMFDLAMKEPFATNEIVLVEGQFYWSKDL